MAQSGIPSIRNSLMSIYQLRYWNQLKEFKTHVIYLHNYAAHSEYWDKAINVFLAITSSSSIAAWAVWQKYHIMWAVIIALSQVVTAVKPFMPFKQRIKAICDLNDKMQEISLECENRWFSVAEGELTEKEIHELCIRLRNNALISEKKCLKSMVLPKNKKILKKAETEADQYLTNNYHTGG
jgi:hypothetical protein